METSESIDELAQALVKAQGQMAGAVKDSSNPYFKSKYADLGSVVKAIKEPFCDNGLSYVQFPFSSERGIGVTTRLMHTSGQWLQQTYTLPMVKHDPQAAGSAITYARRYALQSVAGIPSADDDAESAMSHDNNSKSKPTKPQVKASAKPETPKVVRKEQPKTEQKAEAPEPRGNQIPNAEAAMHQVDDMMKIMKSFKFESIDHARDYYDTNIEVFSQIEKYPEAYKKIMGFMSEIFNTFKEKENA